MHAAPIWTSRLRAIVGPLALVITLSVGCQCGVEPLAEAKPAASLKTKDIDFGIVVVGTSAAGEVLVESTGQIGLHVTPKVDASSSSDFSLSAEVAGAEIEIAPGTTGSIPVLFSPTDKGSDEGVLVLTTDDPKHKTLRARLKGGPAQPTLVFDPDPADFSDASPVQRITSKLITIKNDGAAPLTIADIGVQAGGNPDFSVVPPDPLPVLQPGESTTVRVDYSRTLRSDDGHLVVLSDDPAGTSTDLLRANPLGACGDREDNDTDNLTDYPDDPGCTDLDDDDEVDPAVCLDGATQPCGTDVGACRSGERLCTDGHWGVCVDAIGPTEETCNRVDDDCDGPVDEDVTDCACDEGETRPCGTDTGPCVAGTQTCTSGVWGSCTGGQGPLDEICNGADDDCDGAADEGLPTCDCIAATCEDLAATCGAPDDGCGTPLSCGTCSAPEACDNTLHQCVCTPASSCDEVGAECGTVADGCCGLIACGTCPTAGDTCVRGLCVPNLMPDCSPDGWCFEAPSKPFGESINKVYSFSANDAWIFGGSGRMMHWDGTRFQPPVFAPSTVTSVWGTSSSDLWIASGAQILRFNGSALVAVPGTPTGNGVSGTSANDVWVLSSTTINRFNGSTWSTLAGNATAGQSFTKIVATTSTEAWIVTSGGTYPHYMTSVLRYNGTGWSEVVAPVDLGTVSVNEVSARPGELWFTTTGSAANHVYVVTATTLIDRTPPGLSQGRHPIWVSPSGKVTVVDTFGRAMVREWDGTSWTTTDLGFNAYGEAIAGTADDDVWIGAWYGNIAHKGPSGWTHPSTNSLYWGFDLWGVAEDDLWALAAGPSNGSLLHWDGDSWSDVTCPTIPRVWAVSDGRQSTIRGSAPDDIWIGGLNGVARWDGARWRKVDTTLPEVTAIQPLDANDAYFGTDAGRLFHFDGSDFTEVSAFPAAANQSIHGVWSTGANNIWWVRYDDAVRWNGTSYLTVPKTSGYAYGITGSSNSNVIVPSGPWGGAARYSGGSWSLIGGMGNVYAAYTVSATETWLVGDGAIYFFDGTAASRQRAGFSGFGDRLQGVYAFPSGDIWALGSNAFLRKTR